MATKTVVRAFYAAIRRGELAVVRDALGKEPHLVNACAFPPPKKDDGQSPLQVALKHGKNDIASLLLDLGANVNFIEQSEINEWRAPVLHDAIRAAVLCSGFDELFQPNMGVLERLLAKGADANAVDSYGNTPIDRALLDANQVSYGPGHWPEPKPKNITAVLRALRQRGADPSNARIVRDGNFPEVVKKFLPSL